jgi:glycine oxidase
MTAEADCRSYDREMPEPSTAAAEWDVIVIGAGIIGCAVAREVARCGAKTVVLEARTVGAGATQASAGVLAPFIEAPSDGPLHALTVESLSLYDEFVASVSRDADVAVEYRRCGTLEVAHDLHTTDHLRALADWVASKGVDVRWLDPAAVRQLEPSLGATYGGLLVPSHGYVDATSLTKALVEAARRQGAEVRTGIRVDSISASDTDAEVRAGGESYRARTVVIAAGSWSSTLAPETDVSPVRGQLLRVRWDRPQTDRIIWSERCYLVPWTDGTLLIGATVEQVGFDERVTGGGLQSLLNAATDVLPAIATATFVDARVGLRPATASGLPLISRSTRHHALVYATGHFRNGILLAPLTAKTVADLVM